MRSTLRMLLAAGALLVAGAGGLAGCSGSDNSEDESEVDTADDSLDQATSEARRGRGPRKPPKGQACGARLGNTCKADQFCDFTEAAICGFADATGTCKSRPDVCTAQFDPVCGCDGKTYGNACQANLAGVATQHKGACKDTPDPGDKTCGGIAGLSCDAGQFCNYEGGPTHCGQGDGTGVCQPVPQACTLQYDPVCGCNGKTYGNACEAHGAGVSIAAKGACRGTNDGGTGERACGGLRGLQCAKGEFCNFDATDAMCGAADQTGVCQVIPSACTREYNPVCGCDDKTYNNPCEAHSKGVSIASKGACGGATDGGTGARACGGLLGLSCAKDEFCNFDATHAMCGAADQTGVCQKRPQACAEIYAPVCGCDGKTYGNACEANSAGVSVSTKGECKPARVSCDQRDVLCKRATPKCAAGQVPSVVGSCYGDCVPVEQCGCSEAAECPLPDQYTCWMSAGHCGPFVR